MGGAICPNAVSRVDEDPRFSGAEVRCSNLLEAAEGVGGLADFLGRALLLLVSEVDVKSSRDQAR